MHLGMVQLPQSTQSDRENQGLFGCIKMQRVGSKDTPSLDAQDALVHETSLTS